MEEMTKFICIIYICAALTKMTKFICIIYICAALTTYVEAQICAADDKQEYSYHGANNDPSHWATLFPKNCSSQSQSPINIDLESSKLWTLPLLELVNYDQAVTSARVLNNGVTIEITPTDGVTRSITINGTQFNLEELHFHWGKLGEDGSEHSIDNKRMLMEAQFFHTDANGNFAKLATLVSKDDTSTLFDPVTEILPELAYRDASTPLKSPLKLSDFFAPSPISYFRYIGSLTIPDCTEVIWSISTKLVNINSDGFNALDKIYTVSEEDKSDDCKMAGNFRPIQELNGRTVYIIA